MLFKAGRRRFPSLGGYRLGAQWTTLLVVSTAYVVALEALRLPAAVLLGTMAAAITVAAAEGTVRIAPLPFFLAQGVIGCLMARSITPDILGELLRNWPVFLAAIASVLAASSFLGWLLTRWRVLPGTTAVWGSAPGAAAAMTVLSENFGADMRLVALMQYLRVVFVVIVASVVARLWGAGSAGAAAGEVWFPAVAWTPFAETLAIAGLGPIIAPRLRIPAGSLLLPLAAGAILQDLGGLTIELPPWLLAVSYAVLGWSIGLRFTRPILRHAARALPKVSAAILTLIALCGGFGAILHVAAGVDPLSAYLATSPGGADSVAIITAGSAVDQPFVMALQTARMIVVLLTGPSLARFIARRAGLAAPRA